MAVPDGAVASQGAPGAGQPLMPPRRRGRRVADSRPFERVDPGLRTVPADVVQRGEHLLALGIQKLRAMMSQVGNAPLAYPYLMAISTIASLPFIILFFFAQRTFIEGIATTGMKG